MTAAPQARSSSAQTLPGWLQTQSVQCASRPALRYKKRGLWRQLSFRELEGGVRALAAALARRGFTSGERLFIDAAPSPAALSLSLAAQWLGGAVVVNVPAALDERAQATVADDTAVHRRAANQADPHGTTAQEGSGDADAAGGARFALAGDDAARARLDGSRARRHPLRLGIVLDGEAASEAPGDWVTLEELTTTEGSDVTPGVLALPTTPAIWRGGAELSHEQLTGDVVLGEQLGLRSTDCALAGHALTLGAQLEHVVPIWLLTGFCLSFAEQPATEDGDRRELGPSLLFGAPHGYADVTARVLSSLPGPEQWTGRWIDGGLSGEGTGGRLARRLLTGRLREVLGLARVRHALSVGGATPTAARARFERLFGLSLVDWPDRLSSRGGLAFATDVAPDAATPRRSYGLEGAGLGAASGSDA